MKNIAYILRIFVFASIFFCIPINPLFCQTKYKSSSKITFFLNKIKDALAQSIQNSPNLSSIALYILLFQRNLIKEHPYISAFIGTDLISNFLYSYCKPDISSNALAKTIFMHPISTALIVYALIANQALARNHPIISTFLAGTVAYAWAQNSQQEITNEKSKNIFTMDNINSKEINSQRNNAIIIVPTFCQTHTP